MFISVRFKVIHLMFILSKLLQHNFNFSSLVPAIMTLQPFFKNSLAISKPIPLFPPVIKATRPSNNFSLSIILGTVNISFCFNINIIACIILFNFLNFIPLIFLYTFLTFLFYLFLRLSLKSFLFYL